MELLDTRSLVAFSFGFLNPIPACSSSAWIFCLNLFLTQVFFVFLFFLHLCLSFCHLCWPPAHQREPCLSSEEWCWNMLSQACLSRSVSRGILPGWNWLSCSPGDAAVACHVALSILNSISQSLQARLP